MEKAQKMVEVLRTLVPFAGRDEAQILAALGQTARISFPKPIYPQPTAFLPVRKRRKSAAPVASGKKRKGQGNSGLGHFAPLELQVKLRRPRRGLRCFNTRYVMVLGGAAVWAGAEVRSQANRVIRWMKQASDVGIGPVDPAFYRNQESVKALYALILGVQKLNAKRGRYFVLKAQGGVVSSRAFTAAQIAWRNGKPFRLEGELDEALSHKLPGRLAYPGGGSITDLPSVARLTSGRSVFDVALNAADALREVPRESRAPLQDEGWAHATEREFGPEVYADLGLPRSASESELSAAFHAQARISLDGIAQYLHLFPLVRREQVEYDTVLHGVTLPPHAAEALRAWRVRHLEQ